MVSMHQFTDLNPATAYRFKLRMVDNATNGTMATNWTEHKLLATVVRK